MFEHKYKSLFLKRIVTPLGINNKKFVFYMLFAATFLNKGIYSVRAELYYNPRFLSEDLDVVADLSAFSRGQEVPPGTYRVDIYLNDTYTATQDVAFQILPGETGLAPCFTMEQIFSMGVNRHAITDIDQNVTNTCSSLTSIIKGATYHFDVGLQRLNMTIPQIFMSTQARGYIAPEHWDNGITAAILNYDFNGNRIRDNYGGSIDYAYLNLKSGFNLGHWRFRDNTSWNYNNGGFGDRNQWQHINSYAERDIISLRSRFVIGDNYTTNDIFESVNFRGVNIESNQNMLPDSKRGFAPTVRGIARGTAQVSIKQNGYEIYQNTVPPGPFEINDLYPAGSGGDLQVTVREGDGSIQRFVVPWSSIPVLQREGHSQYSFSAGQFRSNNHQQKTPDFAQGTLKYGLPEGLTIYGGMHLASHYRAFNLGIGKNMGWLGAMSLDATHADTVLPDSSQHEGLSYRFLYSKSFANMGTNIQLTGYRYSTQGYYTFSDSAYKKMKGYNVATQDGVIEIQPRFTDYYNLAYSKREKLQVNVSQQAGKSSTLYLSGSQQNYWGTKKMDRQLSTGFNSSTGDISWSLNYSLSKNIWQNGTDKMFSFNVNIPFSHWMRSDSTSVWRASHARFSQSWERLGQSLTTTGLYGTLLDDNNLGYSVQTGYSRGGYSGDSKTGYASLNYRGGYGNTNVGFSYGNGFNQLNYGLSGGILAHADGLTFSQPMGDTLILVKAPGAGNTRIDNQIGISTDKRGYTVLPYAIDYRENRVALDTNTLADQVDIDNAVVSVVPTHGAVVLANFKTRVGVKLLMTLNRNGKPVPFGSMVSTEYGGESSIVGENGQVYLNGMPSSGTVKVKWGSRATDQCHANFKLPENSNEKLLTSITVDCR